jgi:hypothetical protein
MCMCPIPNGYRGRALSVYSVQCTDKQRDSSHELQSALMLTVEFLDKFTALGKLYQLCQLCNKYRYYKEYVLSLSTISELTYLFTILRWVGCILLRYN